MPGMVQRRTVRATVGGRACVVYDAEPCADYSLTETYAYREVSGADGRRVGPTRYGFRAMSQWQHVPGAAGYETRSEARAAAYQAERTR